MRKRSPRQYFTRPVLGDSWGGGQSETCCPLWSPVICKRHQICPHLLLFKHFYLGILYFLFFLSSLCLNLFCSSQDGDPVIRTNFSNTPAHRKQKGTAPACRLKRCAGVSSTQTFSCVCIPVRAQWLPREQIYSN